MVSKRYRKVVNRYSKYKSKFKFTASRCAGHVWVYEAPSGKITITEIQVPPLIDTWSVGTFLHEMGHIYYDHHNQSKILEIRRRAYHRRRVKPEEMTLIYQQELEAWSYVFDMCRELKIPITQSCLKNMDKSLESYEQCLEKGIQNEETVIIRTVIGG